jgi:methylated-DNA-[protein]-cysteine S-methyltransferase
MAAPFGRLGIRMSAGRVVGVDFLPRGQALHAPCDEPARAVVRAIEAYFEEPQAPPVFTPNPPGTPFQRRVWAALRAIPCGEVVTYGVLAGRLGSGARAVANACRANPIPILIPCHRVLAADGLGGYCGRQAGPMLAIKRWLLAHEAAPA